MASAQPIFPANPQRKSSSAPRGRAALCAVVVLLLVLAMSGILTAPDAARAAQTQSLESAASGLGSGPESKSETPTPNESASSSQQPEGGLTDNGGEESAPVPSETTTPEPTESQAPPRVDRQALIACTPGNVYSVSSPGQLQHISWSGTGTASVTNLGAPPAGGVTQMNGVGVSSGGTVYAYDRTSTTRTANIYAFNNATDTWGRIGNSYDTSLAANGSYNGQLTAGAVDLSNGNYFFGGYTADARQFKLWRFTPSTGAFSYLGFVDTSVGAATSNGDIAFDAQGNLFIARGIGTSTTIYSVTNDTLAAANGGQIAAAGSRSVTTLSGINGIAFDAQGRAYLGGGTTVTAFDMPNFTNPRTVTSSAPTTDLASCSSPATITLEKDVKNRVSSGDQFVLSLNSGSNLLGTATTTGSSNGVQSQRVGPLPVARGTSISISEAASGTTDLARYASSYSCTADGAPINISGAGTSRTFTIPATGNEIICQFVNSPLTANVTVNKQTQNADGSNQQNASGWTVGARATATSGTVSQAPTANTQQTGTDGNAKWSLNFNDPTARANLAVLEQQQSGFEFVSGSCKITRLDGTSTTVTLNSASEQTLSSAIQPGDQVDCGYVNKKRSADVTVNKTWNVNGQAYPNGNQPDGISAGLILDPEGSPSGSPSFGQRRTGFAVGDSVRIGETTTIDQQKFPGCTLKSKTISGPGITGSVPLTDDFSTQLPNASNTYSVTNTVECQSLTIVKNVDNDNGGTLAAADWNQKLFATPSGETRLTFNSGEKKFVPTGSFVISEDSQVGYTQRSIACTGGTYNDSTKTVAIAAGQNAVCTVTNEDSPGTVSWKKTNASGDALDDSEWVIRDDDGTEIALDDCVAASADVCTGRDRDPAAGAFRVEGLDWGGYTLVETRAPAGYVLDETEHDFTISRERLDHQFDAPFVNEQADSPQLPLTGGTGTIGFVIAGAAMLLGCVAGAYWLNRRRRHGRS